LTDPRGKDFSVSGEEQLALSKIILEENHNDKRVNTKAFEGHTVFGTEEKSGDYIYYLWINYGEYSLEKGRLEQFNGLSGPAKIVMELHDEEGFVLKDYQVPRDGSDYDDDIRKIVPALFINRYHFIWSCRFCETILKIPQQLTGLRWIRCRIYYTSINI
jgi:hypothetical protein